MVLQNEALGVSFCLDFKRVRDGLGLGHAWRVQSLRSVEKAATAFQRQSGEVGV